MNPSRLPISADAIAASLLCIAAGFADAIGFIHLGVFAANMTGNTVLLGVSLAHGDFAHVIDRLATVVIFFGGAMLGRTLWRWGGQQAWLALLVEALLLAGGAFIDERSVMSLWVIALAMGVQATAMTKFMGAAVSTVVITSTMARLAESATDRWVLSPMGMKMPASSTPHRLLINTWLSYVVGALLATLTMAVLSHALLVTAGLVLATAWVTRVR